MIRLDGFASASALARLVASLKPIVMDGKSPAFDMALENFKAMGSSIRLSRMDGTPLQHCDVDHMRRRHESVAGWREGDPKITDG